MRVVLVVESGPAAGRRVELRTGETAKFGRTERSDYPFPSDTFMSGAHFVVMVGESHCGVRDLGSSNGTYINAIRVAEAFVQTGDRIGAGQTVFSVRLEEDAVESAPVAAPAPAEKPAQPERPPLTARQRKVIEILSTQQPLFAVLDAARDPMVLGVVRAFADEHQSLYEGRPAVDMAGVAPYLAKVPAGSRLLEDLARGWGQSWGVWLVCSQPFDAVRKHLRQLLMVETEDGRKLFFRFWDPRVLRVFLPTCTPPEAGQVFGPLGCFLMEARNPAKIIRFTPGPAGAGRQEVSLEAHREAV